MQGVIRRYANWSGFALSVLFLVLMFRKVDVVASLRALRSANYWFVALGSCLYLTSFVPRALRWRRLLSRVRRPSLAHLIQVLLIGFMANNVLPFRLGEFFRAYVLSVKEDISRSTTFATIVLEKIADGLTLVAVLSVVALLYPFPGWAKGAGIAAAILFVGALLVALALTHSQDVVVRMIRGLLRRVPSAFGEHVIAVLTAFADGLHFLRSARDVAVAAGLSLIIWSFEAAVYTCATRFGFGLLLPIPVVLLLVIFINLSIIVPSAPAYVGPFQAAGVTVLTQVAAVDKSVALSVSWVLWAMTILPVIGIGLILLSRENLSFSAIGRQQPASNGSARHPRQAAR